MAEYTLDVQLYADSDDIKSLHQKMISFKDYLKSLESRVIDDVIMSCLMLIKISIKGALIRTLLEHKNVYYADLPQQSIYEQGKFQNIDIATIPKIKKPGLDTPFVAVIDSGILPTHPLLQDTVYESEAFGGITTPFDENGHGTMVAGIVLYGDVYEALNSSKPLEPEIRLLNGRVTDQHNKFPDEKILVSVVQEAIEYFASDEFNCKIFNLSLGDDRFPYQQNSKMDAWSFSLDYLNYKFNIATVVSSGNYYPINDGATVMNNYVDYLLNDQDAAIIPPGISVSSLTIGSKIHNVGGNGLRTIPVGEKGIISPFSRTGHGYNKSIKPESTANGGTYVFNTLTKKINSQDSSLGVLSSSLFNNGSWFEVRHGTSFAAPYISHLLGKIKKEIPTAKGNLLRALLINSSDCSTLSNEYIEQKYSSSKPAQIKELQQRINGYGDIREKYLTRSYDNLVTMYHEGDIGIGKINIFEIPIPDEVYSSKGACKINISLAYNPPCRDSRIDYMGVKMSFGLYRGLDLDDVTKYTCKPDDDEFEKSTLPEDKKGCKCKMDPAIASTARGTLLKSTHKLINNAKAQRVYGDTYYLVVKCTKKWLQEEGFQPFAVVVSIEHSNQEVNIYNSIQTRIQNRQRSQTRTRV